MKITYCKTTGKRCYTQKSAGDTLRLSKKSTRHTNIPKRSYYCKDCGFYHLTSLSSKPKRTIKESFDLAEVL